MGKKSRRSRPSKKERKVNNDAMKAKTNFNGRACISTSKCKRNERTRDEVAVRGWSGTTGSIGWNGRWLAEQA